MERVVILDREATREQLATQDLVDLLDHLDRVVVLA